MCLLRLNNIYLSDIKKLAQALSVILSKGDVVSLDGVLGSGKSTLCREIILNLVKSDIDIPSPTYTLVQTYDSIRGRICHMDWYRLDCAEMVFELGIDDYFYSSINLIEWGIRAENYLPNETLFINIRDVEEDNRCFSFIGNGWNDRLEFLKEIFYKD